MVEQMDLFDLVAPKKVPPVEPILHLLCLSGADLIAVSSFGDYAKMEFPDDVESVYPAHLWLDDWPEEEEERERLKNRMSAYWFVEKAVAADYGYYDWRGNKIR